MRSIFLLQFLLVSTHGLTLSPRFADLSHHNGTSLEMPLVDVQELGIDPRFSIRYQGLGDDINSRSAYMNTLHFMTKEAVEDFRGNISGSIMVSEQPWTKVAIVASSVPGKFLERRYVIWALYQGIYHLSLSGFESISLHLEWEDVEVGLLIYISTDDQSGNATLELGNRSNVTQPTSTEGTGQPSLVQQGPANVRSTIEPSYLADAASLSRSSSLLPMVAALNWLAVWNWYDIVETFTAKNEDYGTSFTLLNVGTGPEPHGPCATSADFVAAVWELALFMDRRQRFAEIIADIDIVGRLIGKVLLVKSRGGHAVFPNGTSIESIGTS